MNRIQQALQQDKKLLSIYFTAGFPKLDDTVTVIQELEKSGADMIEIGLPFSDPLADGPTIQESSTDALKNGITTARLFEQLEGIRKTVSIPLIMMGYFNPMMQYGMEDFCKRCSELGIDGLIIPDLPLREFELEYQAIFEKYGLDMVFLITPQTSEARIREIDAASNSFIYMVSTASTTGAQSGFGSETTAYFDRIASMDLKSECIVGFGISSEETFKAATHKAKGAIIGSAFIKMLRKKGTAGIGAFMKGIRPD
ncbi:tryptophan synthase subunit alpha [Gilvibacter sediminis]|uniref:tryptophan synthase subunit alpha n=1 Tax=Gilvibacter sediminis TaxID=379071 RepID=UPI0023503C79|nr:tryptophan synthase subunit alpha [Gilvibacter sediminis]MDC7998505.1 tryptophan synthase subunit alpha [Gilvibacter sediminis]